MNIPEQMGEDVLFPIKKNGVYIGLTVEARDAEIEAIKERENAIKVTVS